MYSCCLRALAKQATSTSRYAAGEAQMAAAVGIEAGNMVKKSHRHHLHSSRAASAYPSPASAPQASTSAAPSGFLQYTTRASSTVSNVQSNDANTMYYQPSAEQVTSHLNTLLEGLQPPLSSELAMRMVTHKGSSSANLSSSQHNTKLSLIGRRVLRLYLAVFLHAHNSTPKSADSSMNDLLERLAHTHTLGRYVAPRWNLERNMHWRQMVGPDGRPTGLEKISGQAVEAILGGLYRQYGAAVALQVFNSRILAFLPLPSELREPAIQLAQRHGDLSSSNPASLESTS